MKITISISEAIDLLLADKYAAWTVREARALAEWYDQLEDDLGEAIDFDVVCIRCDWSSYESIEEVALSYGLEDDELTLEELQQETTVIEVESFICGSKYYPSILLVMDF
jgi:DNA-binding transcriptional regulator YbjK